MKTKKSMHFIYFISFKLPNIFKAQRDIFTYIPVSVLSIIVSIYK